MRLAVIKTYNSVNKEFVSNCVITDVYMNGVNFSIRAIPPKKSPDGKFVKNLRGSPEIYTGKEIFEMFEGTYISAVSACFTNDYLICYDGILSALIVGSLLSEIDPKKTFFKMIAENYHMIHGLPLREYQTKEKMEDLYILMNL